MIRSMNNAVAYFPFGASEHATQYQYGINILPDGAMEDAGVGAYVAVNDAILTKETTNPKLGSQCLRVTYDGTANPYAKSTEPAVGMTYRIIGWARSDGTSIPRLYDGGALFWTGTTSTSWQHFDVIRTNTGGDLRFWTSLAGAGYAEFDDVIVIELRPQTLDVSGSGLHALFGDDGLTPGDFPTKLSTSVGYNYDGANDYMNCGEDSRLAFSDKMTFLIACSSDRAYPSDDGTTKYRGLLGRGSSTGVADYCYFLNWYGTNASRSLRFRISDGVDSISPVIADLDFRPGEIRTIAAMADGSYLRLFVDGEEAATPEAQTNDAQTISKEFTIGSRISATGYGWDGNIYEVAAFNYALPHTEIREYHHDFLRRFRNRI